MTLFTLGLAALSFADLWLLPPPSDSTMVGRVALLLLLRFNEPKRNERDNERDSGLSFFRVDDPDELGDDSATFFSSNEVTNLSRSAKSMAFVGCCALLLLLVLIGDDDDAIEVPSTSESYLQQIQYEREREICVKTWCFINHNYRTPYDMRRSN